MNLRSISWKKISICYWSLFLAIAGGGMTALGVTDPALVGQWSTLVSWPSVSIHTHMLPTGKVLFWDYVDAPRSWDPVTEVFGVLPLAGHNPFCGGHAFLADGRLLEVGGHVEPGVGLPNASIYDPFVNTWTQQALMNTNRWYPTATFLANGDVLALAGNIDNAVGANTLPQVFQVADGSWRNLSNAQLTLANYPRTHLAPNGKVFLAGVTQTTRYLDTSGTGNWTTVGQRIVSGRAYGSLAMYDLGKLIYLGGGSPPTATAEVIDLTAGSPSWRAVGSRTNARRQCNATTLPDGTVLVTGGSSASGNDDPSGAVYVAELWNPATEHFTTLAPMSDYRGYHSGAILLPDARVLSSGGNDHQTGQVFSPPYLFKGARPVIVSAPTSVRYGETFFVETPSATSITKVSWLRSGAATHAFNQNQRINFLNFTPRVGAVTGLNLTAPANANQCPPGYYMLFILNGNGVPSVSRWIQIVASQFQFNLANYNVNEAAGNASVTVDRIGSPVGPATVELVTSNGTANAGSDYTATTTTLAFTNGQTSRTINIPIANDTSSEPSETVNLILRHPLGNAGLGAQQTSVITIIDNDSTPVADFGAIPTNGFAPLAVSFTNLTSGGINNTYLWTLGDGAQSSAVNPVHSYTNTGNFTVGLTVFSSMGTNTRTRINFINVTTPPPPVADFSGTPTNGTRSLAVLFTNLSTGSVTNQFWNFGDGATSNTTAATVAHTYTVAGTYSVSLTVSGPVGTDTKTRTGYIVVSDPPGMLGVSPSSIDFGQVAAGATAQATFVVTNGGGSQLNGTATIDPGAFAVVSGDHFNLGAGESASVVVSFTPSGAGPFNDSIIFSTNHGGDSTNALSGTGIERTLQAVDANATSGGTATVPLELLSLGDENTLRFSLSFDTNLLVFADATNAQLSACSLALGATLTTDISEIGDGRLGIEVALPPAATFNQGPCELARVSFSAGAVSSVTSTPVSFVDSPIARDTSDASASSLATTFTNGTVNLAPLGADLNLTKIAAPEPVDFNHELIYTLAVSNAGPASATGVTVTDALPVTVSYVSASSSSGVCTGINGVVTCDLGSLAPNATASITIHVTAGGAGVITNTAQVAAQEYDPQPADNAAQIISHVNTPASLQVSPTSYNFGSVNTGTTAQTTLLVTNAGGSVLTGTATVSGEPFGVVSGGSLNVPGFGSASVVVRFTPSSQGSANDNVAFSSNGGSAGVPISGSGVVTSNVRPTVTVVASDANAAEPANTGTFTVSRNPAAGSALTVLYSLAGGAKYGSDYTNNPPSSSVVIPAGQASADITVNPIDDTVQECNRKVNLTLSANASYIVGTTSNATVTISDSDLPVVTIAATDAAASEPGTNTGKFTVTRKGCNKDPLTVNYSVGGTAINGTDYTALSGSVSIAAGSGTATIAVKPKDDRVKEPSETVVVTISANANYTLGAAKTATVTITDND